MSPEVRQGRIDADDSPEVGYMAVSKRPLQVLIFLLPLIALYEVGMLFVLRSEGGDTQTNRAHKTLIEFFDVLGIQASGWYLPGLAMIAVLLAWQVLARERWRVDARALAVMAVESIALAVPLIVLAQLIARLGEGAMIGLPAPSSDAPSSFASLSLPQRLFMSVGAGLYEELVFRMLILGAVHALLVDLFKIREITGTFIAVLLSAICFTIYHDLYVGEVFSWSLALFFFFSGVFLGFVFIIRGFGIVVGAHAFYDIVTAFLQ